MFIQGAMFIPDSRVHELSRQTCPFFMKNENLIVNNKYWLPIDRRIEYNYEKYGDSPPCIGEENEIANQEATMRGVGVLAGENEIGELTETKLNIISNDECYEKFLNYSKKKPGYYRHNAIARSLFDGITDQILCTTTACNPDEVTRENEYDKCVS